MLTVLKLVNFILARLGEHKVTEVNIKHPTVGLILSELDNSVVQLCQRRFWFNAYDYTAHPDQMNEIHLGERVMKFLVPQFPTQIRNGALVNSLTRSTKFNAPVKGQIIEYVPFEELPATAQQFVLYNTAVNTQITDIGVSDEAQAWQLGEAQAWSNLIEEHYQQRRYSVMQSPYFRAIDAARRF